jgi:hypothetical protein
VVIYLLGHIAFKWRIAHLLTVDRLVAAIGLVVLIPVAGLLPAVVALLLVTGVMVAVIAYETVHFGEHREQIRHHISTTSQR